MRRYYFPKPYADAVSRLRVPSGFLLVAAFAWFSDPAPWSLLYGSLISALGLFLRGWAAGHLAKNEDLATSGPYRHLRNPLYLGTLTAAAGLVIASRQIGLAILFGAVFLLVYLPVIELEEQHLRKLFPSFADYAAKVPLLLPTFSFGGSGRPFRWSLYKRNEEYQALLGFLAGVTFLAWKAFR
jgi:protein-S-isoprenylcysteine O-methyltransferase Ste14